MNNSIKREQSQTGLSFAERKNYRPQVKKIIQWLKSAILICGTTMVFTSCVNDDNPAANQTLPKSYDLLADE